MGNNLIYKILQYTAQILAIFLIFKFLPELTNGNIGTKLTNVDILMITAIIMLIYILFENLCGVYSYNNNSMTQNEKINLCSSVCSLDKSEKKTEEKKEHMDNIFSDLESGITGGTINLSTIKLEDPTRGISSTDITVNKNLNNLYGGNLPNPYLNPYVNASSLGGPSGVSAPYTSKPEVYSSNQPVPSIQSNQSKKLSSYPANPSTYTSNQFVQSSASNISNMSNTSNPNDANKLKLLANARETIRVNDIKKNNLFGKINPNRFNPNIDNYDNALMGNIEAALADKYKELEQLRNIYELNLENKYEEEYNTNYEKTGKPLDKNKPQIERDGWRSCEGVVESDLGYDTDYNHIPIGDGNDTRDYEYGYSYLPPRDWAGSCGVTGAGARTFPPVCIQNGPLNVPYPYMNSEHTDLLEWTDSIRITGPQDMNTSWVKKFNAGR